MHRGMVKTLVIEGMKFDSDEPQQEDGKE